MQHHEGSIRSYVGGSGAKLHDRVGHECEVLSVYENAVRVRFKDGFETGVSPRLLGYADVKPLIDPDKFVAACAQAIPTVQYRPALPTDSNERKRWPLFSGLLRYFPAALANVSNRSFLGNEKHNPGKPMQHVRDKSSDHEDCVMRHLMDAAEHPPGSPERIDELCGVAWRALALLQVECELAGYRTAPAATFAKDK